MSPSESVETLLGLFEHGQGHVGRQPVPDVRLDDAVQPSSDRDPAVDVALVGLGYHLVYEGQRVGGALLELLGVVHGDGELRNGAAVHFTAGLQLVLPDVGEDIRTELLQPGLDVLEDGLVDLHPDHVGKVGEALHLEGVPPELEGPVDRPSLHGVGEAPLRPLRPLVDQGHVRVLRLTHAAVQLLQHEPEHQQVPSRKHDVLLLHDDLPVDGGHVAGDDLGPSAGRVSVVIQRRVEVQQVHS